MLREIMDCFSRHSTVKDLAVMKSSQVGVTEAVINALGYTMDHNPSPVMVLMPTLEARDTWKIQKLNPLLRETEQIRNILGGLRTRDAANRQDVIDYPGGVLFLSGGNSPNSYAQKTVRILVMDDLDRFPEKIGKEGDPVALGRGRLKAMANSLFAKISTPVYADGLISREYELSDQRKYHVPCPACGKHQVLVWDNVRYEDDKVWYECDECGHEIQEHHKTKMLAQGEWIPGNPKSKRRGYHISAIYAPIGLGPSWADLVEEWKNAQGDPILLQAFVNDNLGEGWEEQASNLQPHELAARAEDIPPRRIPIGCQAITIGIDTQDDWLAVTMLGWGADHNWVLEYTELQGDTRRNGIWDDLEAYLHTWPVNAYGNVIRPRGALIDHRGHRSEEVRKFCQRTTLKIPVFAGQGSTTRMNRPIATSPSYPDKDSKGKVVKRGYGLWNVGTEYCKDFILGQLVSDQTHAPEDRYIRFCSGLPETYFDGLLSEHKNKRNRYEKRKGSRWARNEPLDTIVYAWALGHHRQINIGRTRSGKVDPHYYDRLSAIYEPKDGKIIEQDAIVTNHVDKRDQLVVNKRRKVRSRGVRR